MPIQKRAQKSDLTQRAPHSSVSTAGQATPPPPPPAARAASASSGAAAAVAAPRILRKRATAPKPPTRPPAKSRAAACRLTRSRGPNPGQPPDGGRDDRKSPRLEGGWRGRSSSTPPKPYNAMTPDLRARILAKSDPSRPSPGLPPRHLRVPRQRALARRRRDRCVRAPKRPPRPPARCPLPLVSGPM